MSSTFEMRLLTTAGEEGSLANASEAAAIIGGEDRLALAGREHPISGGMGLSSWIGRWPADVIGAESPLLATQFPHDAFVAACSCGELGCRALIARISKIGDDVVWDEFRSGSDSRAAEEFVKFGPLVFDAAQYEAMVLSPTFMSAWEPTMRRIVHRLGEELRYEVRSAEATRLRFAGAEHLGDTLFKVTAALGRPGDDDWGFLSRIFSIEPDDDPDQVVKRTVRYFVDGELLRDDRVVRRSL